MNDVSELKDNVARPLAQELLLKAANALACVDNDLAQCHAIMALHHLLPEAPMPPDLIEFLNNNGFHPDVPVATEEDMLKGLAESSCNCEECQELSAKHGIAPLVTGSASVH